MPDCLPASSAAAAGGALRGTGMLAGGWVTLAAGGSVTGADVEWAAGAAARVEAAAPAAAGS
jgi:hypothetical protein